MKPPACPAAAAAALNPGDRFADWRAPFDDGWADDGADDTDRGPATTLPRQGPLGDRPQRLARRALRPVDQPYKGCEHGCATFLRARAMPIWASRRGWISRRRSPGNPTRRLCCGKREPAAPATAASPSRWASTPTAGSPSSGAWARPAAAGDVAETCHPVSIVTKSALIERGHRPLADLARDGLVQVMFSVTTLDPRPPAKARTCAPPARPGG